MRGRNVHATPETRYEIDPGQLREAIAGSDDSDRFLVGIYHSHPRTEPKPSEFDVANARWPEQVYVLTSLRSEPPALFAYRIKDGKAEKIPMVES
jgi:desampylase